jgi:hypothetical protein
VKLQSLRKSLILVGRLTLRAEHVRDKLHSTRSLDKEIKNFYR